MKKILPIILFSFLGALESISLMAQDCDCIPLDNSQKELHLNGDNLTLIDNALRCFKLTSTATSQDSLVRVWVLEDDFPHKPTTWRVKMFEFGKNGSVPNATLHVLEWGFQEKDSTLLVKCIKRLRISPNKGWLAFEKPIRQLNLPVLYKNPYENEGEVMVDYGMMIIQFLFGRATYTVDFTGLELSPPDDEAKTLRADHSKRIRYLLMYIERHFSVELSMSGKHGDFSK